MPKISEAERTRRRHRILDAADACRRDGPLTTRRLTAVAGISTGALYHHFPSLDAVAAAASERRVVEGIAAAAAAAPGGADPLAWAVRALVCAPPFAPDAADGDGAGRVVRATLDEVVLAARSGGAVRVDLDDAALVELLEVLWDGLDRRTRSGALRTSLERVAAVLVAALDTGVRPGPNG